MDNILKYSSSPILDYSSDGELSDATLLASSEIGINLSLLRKTIENETLLSKNTDESLSKVMENLNLLQKFAEKESFEIQDGISVQEINYESGRKLIKRTIGYDFNLKNQDNLYNESMEFTLSKSMLSDISKTSDMELDVSLVYQNGIHIIRGNNSSLQLKTNAKETTETSFIRENNCTTPKMGKIKTKCNIIDQNLNDQMTYPQEKPNSAKIIETTINDQTVFTEDSCNFFKDDLSSPSPLKKNVIWSLKKTKNIKENYENDKYFQDSGHYPLYDNANKHHTEIEPIKKKLIKNKLKKFEEKLLDLLDEKTSEINNKVLIRSKSNILLHKVQKEFDLLDNEDSIMSNKQPSNNISIISDSLKDIIDGEKDYSSEKIQELIEYLKKSNSINILNKSDGEKKTPLKDLLNIKNNFFNDNPQPNKISLNKNKILQNKPSKNNNDNTSDSLHLYMSPINKNTLLNSTIEKRDKSLNPNEKTEDKINNEDNLQAREGKKGHKIYSHFHKKGCKIKFNIMEKNFIHNIHKSHKKDKIIDSMLNESDDLLEKEEKGTNEKTSLKRKGEQNKIPDKVRECSKQQTMAVKNLQKVFHKITAATLDKRDIRKICKKKISPIKDKNNIKFRLRQNIQKTVTRQKIKQHLMVTKLRKFLISKTSTANQKKSTYNPSNVLQCEEIIIKINFAINNILKKNTNVNKAISKFKKILCENNVCQTVIEFYTFVMSYTPLRFQEKVLPLGGVFDCDGPIIASEKLSDPVNVQLLT